MTARWWMVEHTADLGLEASAPDLAGLLQTLCLGLCRVIQGPEPVAVREQRMLRATAGDLEALTVELLWQLKDLIQHEGFSVERVQLRRLQPTELEAQVEGAMRTAQHEALEREVKAVTYHQLRVGPDGAGGFHATVLLDL